MLTASQGLYRGHRNAGSRRRPSCNSAIICAHETRTIARHSRGEHTLALKMPLRHSYKRDRKHYMKADRYQRVCRMCVRGAKSPLHALLICTGQAELLERRSTFFGELERLLLRFCAPLHPADALPSLRLLLASPDSAQEMAEFTRAVLFWVF